MEKKNKSGIIRIFSLSLSQAISNKRSPLSSSEKSSPVSPVICPEGDKATDLEGKSDTVWETHSTADVPARHGLGSTRKETSVKSSKNKNQKIGVVKDRKTEPQEYSNLPLLSTAKKKSGSSVENDTKTSQPVFSSARSQSVDVCSPSVNAYSEVVTSVETTAKPDKKNDQDGRPFISLQSDEASNKHNHKESEASSQFGLSSQTGCGFQDTGANTKPSRKWHNICGTQSLSKSSGSSVIIPRKPNSNSTQNSSDRTSLGPKNKKSSLDTESHSYSRKFRDLLDGQTGIVVRKTDKPSSKGQTKTKQGWNDCPRFKTSASADQSPEQLSGKLNSRRKWGRNRNAPCRNYQATDSTVSSNSLINTCSDPPKSNPVGTGGGNSGEEKEHLKDTPQRSDSVGFKDKKKEDVWQRSSGVEVERKIREANRNAPHSRRIHSSKIKDCRGDDIGKGKSKKTSRQNRENPNPTSNTICQVRQRRGNWGTSRPSIKARSSPVFHTTSTDNLDCEAPAPVSYPALDTEDWDCQVPVESLRSKAAALEDSAADLKLTQEMEGTEKSSSSIHRMGHYSTGLASVSAEVFSKSENSKVSRWCNVPDGTKKLHSGTDTSQRMDSSFDIAVTDVNATSETKIQKVPVTSSGGRESLLLSTDKKVDTSAHDVFKDTSEHDGQVSSQISHTQAQPVNVAKTRQASVTTRMRGNHRLKSFAHRLIMADKVFKNSEVNEEAAVNSVDSMKTACNECGFDKCVCDWQIKKSKSELVETGDKARHTKKTAEKISEEKMVQEYFPENFNRKETNINNKDTCPGNSDCADFDDKNDRDCKKGHLHSANVCSNIKDVDCKFPYAENSCAKKNAAALKICLTSEGQLTCKNSQSRCQVSNTPLLKTCQDSLLERDSLNSATFTGVQHEQVYKRGFEKKAVGMPTAVKRPSPLMSLQPKPSAHLLKSSANSSLFKIDHRSRSLDKLSPVAQSCGASPQKLFTKSRPRSRVSSSSSCTPLSSMNSHSHTLSFSSATSYASLSSDDGKDAVTWETDLSKNTDYVSVTQDVSKTENTLSAHRYSCINRLQSSEDLHTQKLHSPPPPRSEQLQYQFFKPLSSSHMQLHSESKSSQYPLSQKSESLDISHCSASRLPSSVEHEKQICKAAPLHTADVNSQVQTQQARAASECTLSNSREIKSNLEPLEHERSELTVLKGKDSVRTNAEKSSCGESERDMSPLPTFQNTSCGFECTDRMSRESSTDTVTETTQEMKAENDDIDVVSVNSLDVNWDSDILPFRSTGSFGCAPSEHLGQQDMDTDPSISFMAYNDAKIEQSQPLHSGCSYRKSGCRKHRSGSDHSWTQQKGQISGLEAPTRKETSREQMDKNVPSQTFRHFESDNTDNKGQIIQSKFLNSGHCTSAMKSTDTVASGIAKSNMKQAWKKSKCRHKSEQLHSSSRRSKERQHFRPHSSLGSECSESFPLTLDYPSNGSDHYLQENDSVDSRCRVWVEKIGKCSVKTEANYHSQSDSNSYKSCIYHSHDHQTEAIQQYHMFGEVWSDSDNSQSCRTQLSMPEGWSKRKKSIENKVCGHAAYHYQEQTHLQPASTQAGREQVQHQKITGRGRALSDSDDPHCPGDTNLSGRQSSISNLKTSYGAPDDSCNTCGQAHGVWEYSKVLDPCQPPSEPSCSNSAIKQNKEHHHSLYDLSSVKVETSSSSECDVDVLSQSDYDDLPAQTQASGRTKEAYGNLPDVCRSHLERTSGGCWQEVCYPPNSFQSLAQSCYSPFHPETEDVWVPTHDPYYEQWYNAWMAYSMACYGYDFQEQGQGMSCNEEHRGQNCGCVCATYQQRHSRPPSRYSSQPPSRPPSSLDNSSHRDFSTSGHDISPSQVENSGQHQHFNTNRRSDEICRVQNEETLCIPSHSFQPISSPHLQDYVHKQPVEFCSRFDDFGEMTMWKKNENGGNKTNYQEEKNCHGERVSESRCARNVSVNPESSSRDCKADEMNHAGVARNHSMNHIGDQYLRFCHRFPFSGMFGLRPNLPGCRGDCPQPVAQFSHPYRFLRPLMPGTTAPFRFLFQRGYPSYMSRLPTASSSYSCPEETKDNSLCDNYTSEQLPYPDSRDFPIYPSTPAEAMYQQDVSRNCFTHQQQQKHSPPQLAPPPPRPPPLNYPYPDQKGTVASSCGLDTSSELCHLDSSLDRQGEYDASISDQGEDGSGGETVSTKRKRSALPESSFNKFVAAQKERYLKMYKDSGSEDLDSSSFHSSVTSRASNAQEEHNSSGKEVTPKRRESSGKGLLHSLQRRAIPTSSRNHGRRSCPPVLESLPAAPSSDQSFGKNVSPWAPEFLSPPTGMSYAQAVSSPGAWWDKTHKPNLELYQENCPTLSAASSSQTPDFVLASFKTPTKNNSLQKDQTSFSDGQVEGSCKTFFRKKPFLSRGVSGRGMSRYTSRLLNDNRLSGVNKWGKEAREAFHQLYKTTFVDTHCHLDFLFSREPYSGSFASYRDKNMNTFPKNFEGCVAVFCRPKSFTNESKWKPIVEEDGVWMAMGCHPKNACEYTEWSEMGLRWALKHKKTVALGEIGLDYSKNYGQTSAQQKEVFIRQIKVALEMQLPLVIHCREAEDDCLEILEEHVPADYKIHCHCFTTDYNSCLKWTSRFKNLFIGLTPLVTYRSAVATHQVAQHLPLEKLLFETDAPYFLPNGFEGEGKSLSHPGMALMVAIRVAELRGIEVEEVLTQVRRNTKEMYGI